MRRPLKDRSLSQEDRFPFLDRPAVIDILGGDSPSKESTETSDDNVHFDSVDDLPDSPMLRQYVNQLSEYFDKPKEEIINTQPVRDYMKRLGVWEQAKQRNR